MGLQNHPHARLEGNLDFEATPYWKSLKVPVLAKLLCSVLKQAPWNRGRESYRKRDRSQEKYSWSNFTFKMKMFPACQHRNMLVSVIILRLFSCSISQKIHIKPERIQGLSVTSNFPVSVSWWKMQFTKRNQHLAFRTSVSDTFQRCSSTLQGLQLGPLNPHGTGGAAGSKGSQHHLQSPLRQGSGPCAEPQHGQPHLHPAVLCVFAGIPPSRPLLALSCSIASLRPVKQMVSAASERAGFLFDRQRCCTGCKSALGSIGAKWLYLNQWFQESNLLFHLGSLNLEF